MHMNDCNKFSSPAQARAWFIARGVNITEWSDANGFKRELVYAVLAGRIKGDRGKSHQVAVRLGLKALPHSAERVWAHVADEQSKQDWGASR